MSTGENPSRRERLVDLMVDQTTCGLNQAEQDELSRLPAQLDLPSHELQNEIEQLELSVAAADLGSFRYESDSLPATLRDKLLLQAGQFFSAENDSMEFAKQALGQQPPDSSPESKAQRRPLAAAPLRWREMVSILAAAACILLLLSNWNKIFTAPKSSPSVAQLEAKFLQSKPSDLIDIPWKPGPDPYGAKVSGRLAWSTEKQEGFMTFDGLKANDPSVEQYQLWIFETADQEHPIDGGVFDITGTETKIQIDPKIKVDKGVLFAITVEDPGGVVVSDRSRIAAVATP